MTLDRCLEREAQGMPVRFAIIFSVCLGLLAGSADSATAQSVVEV